MQEARTSHGRGGTSPRPDVYDRVRTSQLSRGASVERAEEAAARTAVKYGVPGPGVPGALPLEEQTRDALYERARQLGVRGRSGMSKAQLLRAVREA